jgi:hemoglobin
LRQPPVERFDVSAGLAVRMRCPQRRVVQHQSREFDMRRAIVLMGILAAVLAFGALPAEARKKSLYDRLGGQTAIVAVVDQLVVNVVADTRISGFFAKTEPTAFKAKLVTLLCQITGGPCKYTGLSMKAAHKGRGIKDADFAALVEDLGKSFDTLKVAKKDQKAVLARLVPLKKDVVEK